MVESSGPACTALPHSTVYKLYVVSKGQSQKWEYYVLLGPMSTKLTWGHVNLPLRNGTICLGMWETAHLINV
jgi:hypothetical protein